MTKEKVSSFGACLRSLREEAGLPLRKVAAELDIDQSLLAKFERGERSPSKDIIRGVAKIFGQNEHKLLIEHLSDQIAYQLMDEEDGLEALKVAEKKVGYLKKEKRKQSDKNNLK